MGRKSIPPLVLKDILRLRANGLSFREIGERCGLSHTAVRLYYQQAQAKDLKWDKAKYHSESKLVQEFKRLKTHPSKYHEPDFDEYAKLLYLRKIRGIDDAYAYYCEDDKSGEKYSRASFFRLFQKWRQDNGENKLTFLSHNWAAGECCQIDYSGDTLTLIVTLNDDRIEYRSVQIFVGVLPIQNISSVLQLKIKLEVVGLKPLLRCSSFSEGFLLELCLTTQLPWSKKLADTFLF